jgi:hypothetical protein
MISRCMRETIIDISPLDPTCLYQLMFTPGGTSVCLQRPCCFLISSSLSLIYLSITLPTLACQSKMLNLFTRGLHVQTMPVHSPCIYTVQKEQRVRLVSLMKREIILYMASTIYVSSYLADFYLLSKFALLE